MTKEELDAAEVELQDATRRLQADKDDLERRTSELEQREGAADDVALSLLQREERLNSVITPLKEKISSLEDQQLAMAKESNNAISGLDTQLSALGDQLQSEASLSANLSREKEHLRAALDDAESQIGDIRSDRDSMYDTARSIAETRDQLQRELEELRSHFEHAN